MNAAIFHGWGGKPGDFWYPYLKKGLEARGYSVWLPQLPNADDPSVGEWLNFTLKNGEYNEETVLIGHSMGGPLILALLEELKPPIRKAVIVSGFVTRSEPNKMLKDAYDWKKIKGNCKEFVFINSDNDPYDCNDKQGRLMLDKLGGIQVIISGEGHFGSFKCNQPYETFPLLLKLALD
ncbi:MAG: alpha/beta fold hydrolase [Candidatus Micrarchaeia archaeon]